MADTYIVKEIQVKDIITDGQMVRETMDDDYIMELSLSIQRNGLLQPIVVTPAGDKYQLRAGAHRLAAAKRLRWETIPAKIYEAPEGTTIKTTALTENLIRRQMTIKEECLAILALVEDEGLSRSQICDLLGKSTTWVDTRLALMSYPVDVQEAVYDGSLSLQKADVIAMVEDDGIRRSILNQTIVLKLRLADVRSICQVAQDVPSLSEATEAGLRAAEEVQKRQKLGRTCDCCGRFRPWENIRVWWVCVEGCENVPDEIPEDHDDSLGGTMDTRSAEVSDGN